MRAHFDYAGCAVFVAGGTSGINLGIAQAFSRAGARLGVASRSPAKVAAACEALSNAAGEALGFPLDVRDAPAVEAAFAAFAAKAGPIDVVVSGAAGNFPALAQNISPNGFKAVMDIDVLGTFHVMRAAFAHLRRPGGCLINISAPQSFVPMSHQAHVCAAKAGVDMLTRTLAIEWGVEGIRVNSVVPGPIAGTEGMARLAPDEAGVARVARSVPLGRMGTPQDIANACLFLGSQAAGFVTGAVVPVDGGWSQVGAPLGLEG